MKNHKFGFLMPVLVLSLVFWSCTSLDENPGGLVTPDNFFQTEAELTAAVIPVYASLRAFAWSDGYLQLQEHTSDELFVPQRGGDWGDGGTWRSLQEHTWVPSLGFINAGWNDNFQGIARANSTLESLRSSSSGSSLIPTFIAEVRFIRALFYFALMDMFGSVPLVTDAATDPDNPPSQSTRQELFDFIVQELNAALPDLEVSFGSGSFGRVTKGAANTLLATVYLNAEVYTGTAKWSECVAACDAVINSGVYDLLPDYNEVFSLANEGASNRELILVVGNLAEDGLGFFRQNAAFHYNQLRNTPWNGFSVLEDFFNKFDRDDVRFQQILVGAQFVLDGPNAGQPAFDRNGNPLVFTPDSPIIGADEGNGPRLLKWPIDPGQNGANAGNDLAIYRYSHVLLAKAEALFNLGNTGEALALVNQVRARDFEPDKPLAALTSDLILDERGFEFLWESFRRQDQIRHGKFLEAWTLKAASDGPHRLLFPIPQTQLDANPNLVQNPGY